MATITPSELSARLSGDGPGPSVIDVQPEADFADWHVPGSVHLDISDELRADPHTARDVLAKLPRDREVIVVCTAGEPAQLATDLLVEMGHDVKMLGCHRP